MSKNNDQGEDFLIEDSIHSAIAIAILAVGAIIFIADLVLIGLAWRLLS